MKIRPGEERSDLRAYFPFWDDLTESEKKLAAANTAASCYQKGQTIHDADDECLGMIIVKSGSLRTYMLSEEGREITLYRIYGGDRCILSASCVLKNITFEVFIEADEDTELMVLSAYALSKIMESNIHAECYAYKLAAKRFSDVMWAFQQILFISFDKRLAMFLNDELEKTGGDTVRLTHEQIAKYMGSAREVVSRMLKYFATEGIAELSRGGVRITDRKKLAGLI